MAKYNITEKKEKEAAYRTLVSPKLMDELKEKIIDIILVQKKFKDKEYSAKRLAEELGTNTRYISAVVNVRFHMNYTIWKKSATWSVFPTVSPSMPPSSNSMELLHASTR